MQRLSGKTCNQLAGFWWNLFRLAAINWVARQRMTYGVHVHTNLMRATSFQAALQQGAAIKFFNNSIVCTCFLSIYGYRHFCAMYGVSSYRCINPSVSWDIAKHQRQILARYRMFLQLSHQAGLRFKCFRYYQQTAGIFIEPMNDTRTRYST